MVSALDLAVVVVSLTLATFVTRSGMLLVGERLKLSAGLESAFRFAPACALAALVPDILYPAGTLDLTRANPRWPAALAAALFLVRTAPSPGVSPAG